MHWMCTDEEGVLSTNRSCPLGSPHPPLSEAARPPFSGFGTSGRLSMVVRALGQETKYQPPVCVVPEIFALNGSTQQASGGGGDTGAPRCRYVQAGQPLALGLSGMPKGLSGMPKEFVDAVTVG